MCFIGSIFLQEMISDALRKLLPEYSLQISIVESTEQLFDAISDGQVDIVMAEFSYLLTIIVERTDQTGQYVMSYAPR